MWWWRRAMRGWMGAVALIVLLVGCEYEDGELDENQPTNAMSDAETWTPGGSKPTELPPFSSLSLYADNSPLNQPIGLKPTVDPNSETLAESMTMAGALVVQVGQYSAPVFFADASSQRSTVHLACGEPWEMGVDRLVDVPIPGWAEPAFDADGGQAPQGCGEEAAMDNHMVILDLENRCEYDFWQMRRQGNRWTASWANALSMDSQGIYSKGLSSRGSGFAFTGGVIWPDELAAGEIKHALVFSYPFARAGGPVAPASESDGTNTEDFAIPEGARLQLDPMLDLDALGLTDYEKTIARALQVYGMFLVDVGGDSGVGLYAVDPKSSSVNPYAQIWGEEDFVELENIPVGAFRVLEMGPQDAEYLQQLALVDGPCAQFR